MSPKYFRSLLVATLLVATVSTTTLSSASALRTVDPVPRQQSYHWMSLARWYTMHAEQVAVAEKGEARFVFLGDSITEAWVHQKEWQEVFAPQGAAGFGIGGDTTQNVIWRLQNGGVSNLNPEWVVLMIGTNNLSYSDAEPMEVIVGVRAVVAEVRRSFPEAKLLLFGIFPRDEQPDTPMRRMVAAVNADIAHLHDGETIFFEDIGERFLEEDGTISPKIMPDFLHLSAEGYARWAEVLFSYLPVEPGREG